jgi:hypothetical protein
MHNGNNMSFYKQAVDRKKERKKGTGRFGSVPLKHHLFLAIYHQDNFV